MGLQILSCVNKGLFFVYLFALFCKLWTLEEEANKRKMGKKSVAFMLEGVRVLKQLLFSQDTLARLSRRDLCDWSFAPHDMTREKKRALG